MKYYLLLAVLLHLVLAREKFDPYKGRPGAVCNNPTAVKTCGKKYLFCCGYRTNNNITDSSKATTRACSGEAFTSPDLGINEVFECENPYLESFCPPHEHYNPYVFYNKNCVAQGVYDWSRSNLSEMGTVENVLMIILFMIILWIVHDWYKTCKEHAFHDWYDLNYGNKRTN